VGIKKLFDIVQLLLSSKTSGQTRWDCFINCAMRSWILETENSTECSADELQQEGKKLTPVGLKQVPPGRLWRCKLEKMSLLGKKRSILYDSVKSEQHTSTVKQDIFQRY
jgi:hypothetical protein